MSSPSLLTAALPASQICVPQRAPAARRRARFRTRPLVDRFLFVGCLEDPELGRRARLAVWFGFLGFFFSTIYAAFVSRWSIRN